MNKKTNPISEIKIFLKKNPEEIQQLATRHHKQYLGVKKYRKEIIKRYQKNHNTIISKLSTYLEQKDTKKGLEVFKKLAVTIARSAVKNKLTIEEAVDGIIFLKHALWEKVEKAGFLKKLTAEEFYRISHLSSIYIDTIASRITFEYHELYIRTVLKEAKERKITEQILKDERKFAEDIVDTVREPLIVLNAKLRVISANKAFYSTFKTNPKQTEGNTIYNLGNNQWRISELQTLLESILPHKKVFNNFEVTHTFPSIGKKTMLLNARSIDHVQLILLAIEDITERKNIGRSLHDTEERFKLLVEGTKDYVMMMLDKHGTVTSWNKGGEHLLGYSEHEILGRNFSLFFTPEDRKMGRPAQELEHSLKTGKAIDENWMVRKDNSTFWASGVTTALYDEEGGLRGLSKIARDITTQWNLEHSKDEFMGIVSHELKTPVTSIKAFVQVMQTRLAKEGNEKSVVLLKKMDAQINKLTALIGDLLDVTKIEGGKLQFHEEHYPFDELVSEIVEEVQRTTEKHTIIKEGRTGKMLFGDRNRIGQVMTNLLTNATKYSPHAKKIIVRTNVLNRKNIIFCVKDFGIGIPKEKQSQVFERFFRVEGKQTETFGGLGLGLYVASEIIKRQGGNIWVDSEEGKGSVFCFMLPIKGSEGKRQQENTFAEEEIKHG